MSTIERLRALTDRIETVRETVTTEEATKTALILPLLQALGYDVFNPLEVVPEFTADVGIKRGEKVDYAVMREGKPILLIECKCCGQSLGRHSSQLYRYFNTTDARVAVLTDGIHYKFFADLHEPNRMDPEPFLTLDLSAPTDKELSELARLGKGEFDLDEVLTAAESLRTAQMLRERLERELAEPSDEFVKVIATGVHPGRWSQANTDRYRSLLKAVAAQAIRDRVDTRLRLALDRTAEPPTPEDNARGDSTGDTDDGIETTMEELSGLFVVKAIVRDQVDLARVVARDTKSYFGVLLDDNNRKPICRLRFNRTKKYLSTFDAYKNETTVEVGSPDDLFAHADAIRVSLTHALARS